MRPNVAGTGGFMYAANVWALFIVQAPFFSFFSFSCPPCQTLLVRFAVWECPPSADRKPNMVQVRYYSISSSAVVAPTTPSLTVAVVEETMKSGRVHRGVASTWLVRTPLPSQQSEREIGPERV